MLKRIKLREIRLGMFIEAVDGEWSGRPFWRSRFRLDCIRSLEALKTSGAISVIIDTDLGADTSPASSKKNAARAQRVSQAEIDLALRTIEQSKSVIKDLFDDVRMGNCIKVRTAMDVVTQITESMSGGSRALITLSRLKTRDEYTFLHSMAVTALMVHLAKSIKIDAMTIQMLGMGGLLHDVGKVKIPLTVLNKTGPLSETDLVLVRRHPCDGHEQLSRQGDMPEIVLDICLHHHERLDGKGYPKGLSGDEISLPVRIASICDVYDALTSKRAYKKAWPPADAAKFMLEQKGQFDRTLLRQFFHCLSL